MKKLSLLICLFIANILFSQSELVPTKFIKEGSLHEAANLSSATLIQFKKKQKCQVIAYLGDEIYKINFKDNIGYVDSENIDVTEDVMDLYFDYEDKLENEKRRKALEKVHKRQQYIQKVVQKREDAEQAVIDKANAKKQEELELKRKAEEQKQQELAEAARKREEALKAKELEATIAKAKAEEKRKKALAELELKRKAEEQKQQELAEAARKREEAFKAKELEATIAKAKAEEKRKKALAELELKRKAEEQKQQELAEAARKREEALKAKELEATIAKAKAEEKRKKALAELELKRKVEEQKQQELAEGAIKREEALKAKELEATIAKAKAEEKRKKELANLEQKAKDLEASIARAKAEEQRYLELQKELELKKDIELKAIADRQRYIDSQKKLEEKEEAAKSDETTTITNEIAIEEYKTSTSTTNESLNGNVNNELRSNCHYLINEYDQFYNVVNIKTEPYKISENLTIELHRQGRSLNVFFNLDSDLGCASYLPGNRSSAKVVLENNQTIIFYHSWGMDCGTFGLKAKLSKSQILKLEQSPIKQIILRGTEVSQDIYNVEYKEFFMDKLKCLEY